MPRCAEQVGDRGLLDLAAGIHHHHPLGDLRHHPEIVGDEDDGGADPALELRHQLEDLRLDRDVERGGRLIGDQDLRLQASAIAIITRWRIPPDIWWDIRRAAAPARRCDEVEHRDGARPRGAGVEALVQAQRLAELAADAQHRVEARHRSWKIMLMSLPRIARMRAVVEREEIAALEADRARDLAGRLGNEAQDRHGGDRFPAPLSPTIASVSPCLDMERHPVDGTIDPVRRAEVGLKPVDFESAMAVYSLSTARLQTVASARIEGVAQAVADEVHRETVIDRNAAGRTR